MQHVLFEQGQVGDIFLLFTPSFSFLKRQQDGTQTKTSLTEMEFIVENMLFNI